MKKIVIVLLLLIPLIVLFTISASGMILSAEVVIEIENFELWHQGQRVTEVTINYGEYNGKGMTYQLIPRYFPGVAKVSGFRWYSDDHTVATVDEKGLVTFRGCGVANVTAESMDAVSIKATCSFFVEDDVIHKIEIFSFETGEKIEELQLLRYESRQIRTEITPYKALSGNPIYLSSDENVFLCDQSGVLTATGEGSATLTVTAANEKGAVKSVSIPVTVAGNKLAKQSTIYVYGNTLDLTPYLAAGSVGGSKELDVSTLAEGESRTYQVTGQGKSENITVLRLPNAKTIGMRGYEEMLLGDWKMGAYLSVGRTLFLTPIDLLTSEALEGAEISSDHPEVLQVVAGGVKAVARGTARLTIRKEGYYPFEVEMVCADPISYFALNFNEKEDEVGLGSERVFGTKSFYNGEISDGINIVPEKIYPQNSDHTYFSYSVEGSDATVDEYGHLTFPDTAVGKEITVTVRSLYSTNALTRSYTFKKIVKGINVGLGYGANSYDEENGIIPSFTPYYDAVNATYEDLSYALVFQTNVYLPSRQEVESIPGKYQKIALIRDLYGNGYKIDGQFYQYTFSSAVFTDSSDELYADCPEGMKVEIRDLFINSFAPVGKSSLVNFSELVQRGGVPVKASLRKRSDVELLFRYCVFQYAYSHFTASGGKVSFDGCIFRNSAGASFILGSADEGTMNEVSVHNCIFSHTLSLAGLISNGTIGQRKKAVYYNSLNWTGNNYIFNWKKTDDVRLDFIPLGFTQDRSLQIALSALNDKLNECAKNSVIGNQNAPLQFKKGNDTYMNMGIFLLDYWKQPNLIINQERSDPRDGFHLEINEEQASALLFKMNITALGDLAKKAASPFMELDHANIMITNKSKDGSFNTQPGETYKLDQKTFRRLRGEVE